MSICHWSCVTLVHQSSFSFEHRLKWLLCIQLQIMLTKCLCTAYISNGDGQKSRLTCHIPCIAHQPQSFCPFIFWSTAAHVLSTVLSMLCSGIIECVERELERCT